MKSHAFSQFLHLLILLVLAIAVVVAGTVVAQPNAVECQVPSGAYATIQDALADAACTTVVLGEGRFQENLVIERPVSIEGVGAAKSIVDGQEAGRVIHIKAGAVVTLSDLSIVKGQSGLGGGIFNEGEVTLYRLNVSKNTAGVDGGGLHNVGKATIYDSTFRANTAVDFSGGGLRNEGRMHLNNSTVSQNQADFSGGGISNEDEGKLWIFSSTITGNRGGVGGGIAGNEHGGGFVRIKNTLVSDNFHVSDSQPSDCAREIDSLGYNQVADTDFCNFQSTSGDILRRPAFLGKREGIPAYYPLTSLSPAIDSGDPAGCVDHRGDPLVNDQRGLARDARCDIGSVEFEGPFNRVYLPAIMNIGCADFFDDFSNPRSGWPVEVTNLVKSEYLNGEYRVFTKNPDFFYLFLSPACARDYYKVVVDARWVDEPGAILGILFASSEEFEEFYFFFVNTDFQVYSIVKVDGENDIDIVPLTGSDAINVGGETNRLEIHWEKDRIKAVVNDIELGEWPVSGQLKPSFAGVFAGSYIDQNQSDARFDNFSIVTKNTTTASNLARPAQTRTSAEIPFSAVNIFPRLKE